MVSSFFELLYSYKVREGGEDIICWIPSKRIQFKVKSYKHVLLKFPFFLEEYLKS